MLSAAERLGLLGDEWAMVRAWRHEIGTYLDVAAAFAGDEAAAVVDQLASRLAYAVQYLMNPSERGAFADWIRRTFKPVLDSLGTISPATDSDERQSRRAALIG